MADKQWKATERRIAREFGGKRTGPGRPNDPDIRTSWLSIEVKERKFLPLWLSDSVRLARAKARGDQLGIVVIHETRLHHDFVLMDRKDFLSWFGGEKKEEKDNG